MSFFEIKSVALQNKLLSFKTAQYSNSGSEIIGSTPQRSHESDRFRIENAWKNAAWHFMRPVPKLFTLESNSVNGI